MRGDDVPADRHAEAGAVGFGRFDRLLQDGFEGGGRQAAAVVGNRKHDPASLALDLHRHMIGARFEGVLDQVLQQADDFKADTVNQGAFLTGYIDPVGAEKKHGFRIHGSGENIHRVNFTGVLGGLAPRFREMEAERGTFLQGFGIVEDAIHVASDLG